MCINRCQALSRSHVLLNVTDEAVKCLVVHCPVHALFMQIKSTGAISTIVFATHDTSYLLQSSDEIFENQPDNPLPPRRDSMLARFDRLCELLGRTLREVLIISRFDSDSSSNSAVLTNTISAIHEQMPNMVRRQSLSLRRPRTNFDKDVNAVMGEACRSTFMSHSLPLEDVELPADDQQPPDT